MARSVAISVEFSICTYTWGAAVGSKWGAALYQRGCGRRARRRAATGAAVLWHATAQAPCAPRSGDSSREHMVAARSGAAQKGWQAARARLLVVVALFLPEAHLQPARLEVGAVRAGDELAVRLGSGEPRLEVVLFGGRVVLPTVTAGTGARQLGAAGLMVPWIRALKNERTSAPDTMLTTRNGMPSDL